MTSFLPSNYKVPQSGGNYLKLKSGDNRVRIMGNPLIGWVYFNSSDKPVRSIEKPENMVNPKEREGGTIEAPKEFWAMPIWDYSDKTIKIAEITQKSIKEAIVDLHMSEFWGDPLKYDLNIKKSGEKLSTEYNVQPLPATPVPVEAENALIAKPIKLEALLTGGDPFAN